MQLWQTHTILSHTVTPTLHSLYIQSYTALLCPLSSWPDMCCPWRDAFHPPNSALQNTQLPSALSAQDRKCKCPQPSRGNGSIQFPSPFCLDTCVHVCVRVAKTLLYKTDQKPEDQMLSLAASGRGMIRFPISCDDVQMELPLL